jgi:hypothetical protein
MKRTFLLIAALCLGACAGATPSAQLATAGGDRVVCRYEKVTGQHRREKVCMSEARRAEIREAAQMRSILRQNGQQAEETRIAP